MSSSNPNCTCELDDSRAYDCPVHSTLLFGAMNPSQGRLRAMAIVAARSVNKRPYGQRYMELRHVAFDTFALQASQIVAQKMKAPFTLIPKRLILPESLLKQLMVVSFEANREKLLYGSYHDGEFFGQAGTFTLPRRTVQASSEMTVKLCNRGGSAIYALAVTLEVEAER